MLLEKVTNEGWGAKTLQRLAKDLKQEFPHVSGFSVRNLQYMRKFAVSYPEAIYAAAAAQIPWGHNMVILDKLENTAQRNWYIQQVTEMAGVEACLSLGSNLIFINGKERQ